jgi:hypothetical protein
MVPQSSCSSGIRIKYLDADINEMLQFLLFSARLTPSITAINVILKQKHGLIESSKQILSAARKVFLSMSAQ